MADLLDLFRHHPQANQFATGAQALGLSEAEQATLKSLSGLFPARDALLLVLLARNPAWKELSPLTDVHMGYAGDTSVPVVPGATPLVAAPAEAPAPVGEPGSTPPAEEPAPAPESAPVEPATVPEAEATPPA